MNDEIPSPCTLKCHLHEGICQGCGRTAQEIAGWSNMTNDDKISVLNRLIDEHWQSEFD